MIQAEYRRELNRSYMVVKNSIQQLTQQYAYRMIRENSVRRLLPCQERIVDGESYLYFEISSRQALAQFYDGRRMHTLQIAQILRAIVQVQEDMGEYLLDGAGLLMEPSCIFIDVETEELYFCFYPGWRTEGNVYLQLADFFLEYVDHGQETAVNLAYQFYKSSKPESFVLASFMPWVEKECAAVSKKVSMESSVWISETNQHTEQAYLADNQKYDTQSFCFEEAGANEIEDNAIGRDTARKENWIKRLFHKKKSGRRYFENGHQKEEYPEESRSLWDVYADKLENREEGETIYFADLEKPLPKPEGVPCLAEIGGTRQFSLETLPVTVGKLASRAEIVLDDPAVSRMHARFFSEINDLWLMDLNSRNGTIVNGKKLAPNEAVKVEFNDEIQFGRERFRFTFVDSQKE